VRRSCPLVVKIHQVVRDLEGNIIGEGMVEHVYLINRKKPSGLKNLRFAKMELK
jgi:hypothetical protein